MTHFKTDSTPDLQTIDLHVPASTSIKAGWSMFWLGCWAFIRRRAVSYRMGWHE